MLKLIMSDFNVTLTDQPPSGGCVLKLGRMRIKMGNYYQPPSGGCVLKRTIPNLFDYRRTQPPSGGCVLKPPCENSSVLLLGSAAFGRLRVETIVTLPPAMMVIFSRLRAAAC